jgi:hypothetical protein
MLKNAKAYASGLAAFIGSIVITLTAQVPERQGIEYMTQLQWLSVALYVLASYGITWRVPNASVPDLSASLESPARKRGDHAA